MPHPLRLSGHVMGLDVLRGVAVGAVLIFHNFFDGGYQGHQSWFIDLFVSFTQLGKLGVSLFFVLSGFLITSILLRQRDKDHYYRTFYIRRALRILPAYLLLLVVLKSFDLVHWHFVLACMLFIANAAQLVHSHPYEYGVLWTLAVEEQFYLVWPTFVRRFRRTRTLIGIAMFGIVLAPLLRFELSLHGISTYLLTPTNMDTLLSGALCAALIANGSIHTGNLHKIVRVLFVVGTIATLPLLYHIAFPHVHGRVYWAIWNALSGYGPLCLFVAGVLYSVERAQIALPRRPGAIARASMFFGYISYGLYLVHPLIFSLYVQVFAGTFLGDPSRHFSALCLRFLLAGGFSVGIATLSRRYYEEFFLRRKKRLAPERAEPPEGGIPARS